MRRGLAGLGAVVLGAGLLVGCGSEEYSASKVCGVDTDLVAAVVGDRDFTVNESDTKLPLKADAPSSQTPYFCSVREDDEDVVKVDVTIASQDVIDTRAQAIEEAETSFKVAEGTGAVRPDPDDDDFEGLWQCGSTSVRVRGPLDDDGAVEDAQALVEGFAEQAGCEQTS